MIFLPKEHASRLACEQEMERAIKAEGQVLLGWRDVPVNRDMPMSPTVRAKEPVLRQVFIGRGNDVIVQDALERKLYVIRKTASANHPGAQAQAQQRVLRAQHELPHRGLQGPAAGRPGGHLLPGPAGRALRLGPGLVHQRFSTNTFPEWPLAHPYRYVAHNGEINTVKGNYNWMKAREGVMSSPVLGDDLQKLYPISFADQSDTATFDNCLELLTMAGYPLSQAVMMMIPEPWEQHTTWTSAAAPSMNTTPPCWSPGTARPPSCSPTAARSAPRWTATACARRATASPTTTWWSWPPSRACCRSREQDRAQVAPAARQDVPDRPGAGPHDRRRGAQGQPRQQPSPTSSGSRTCASSSTASTSPAPARSQHAESLARPPAGLWLHAGRHQVPDGPMATNGEEGIGSMGNDSPLAVLSDKNKPLYNYFKQLFAQVTNPPIDPIREAIVMSLNSFIGPKPNLLDINQVNPPMRLEVSQPVLDFADMAKLRDIEKHTNGKFKSYDHRHHLPAGLGP
jgi:glutamate synthase (NADPH/NADH) large chain